MPRVITESKSSPCFMNKPDPKSPAHSEPAPEPRKAGALVIRLLVVLVIVLATVAVIAVAVPWGRYRYDHIVLSEATIKGTVAKIGVRLEGRIKSVEVDAGQRVARGDVLLKLEDRHLEAARDRARGALRAATKDVVSGRLGIDQSRRRPKPDLERPDA